MASIHLMRVDQLNLPGRLLLLDILQVSHWGATLVTAPARYLLKGPVCLIKVSLACKLVTIDSSQRLPVATSTPELQSNLHHLSLEDRSVEAVMGSCASGCLRVCPYLEWLTLPYGCYLSERRRTVCMGES